MDAAESDNLTNEIRDMDTTTLGCSTVQDLLISKPAGSGGGALSLKRPLPE